MPVISMKALRKLSSTLHLYLGLVAGLLLVPIGLTGSILIFHDTIGQALNPEMLVAAPQEQRASLESVLQRVRQSFPDREILHLRMPREETDVYEVTLDGDDRQVYVDPYRGTVLGSRLPDEGLTGTLFDLHVRLLGGSVGETVVGILGIVLIVISLTGLILWWRGPHQIKRSLTIEWRAGTRRLNYDLHNVLGFGSSILLVMLAFTGSGLVFYYTFYDATHAVTGTQQFPPPPESTPAAQAEVPSIDDMITQVREVLPHASVSRIDFPTAADDPLAVRLKQPEEIHQNGMTFAYIDQYSGDVLRVDDALDAPLAAKLAHWLYPFHTGVVAGTLGRGIVFVLGLVPTVLLITGFLIWRWPNTGRSGIRETTAQHRVISVELPGSEN